MKAQNRRAFTLTELLVVIAILLVISVLSFAVFGTGKSSDKMRSGARNAQAAFLGAKDRAQHAKDLRGVRLTHMERSGSTTTEDAYNFVNGFVYIVPIDMQTYPNGSFRLERVSTAPPDATVPASYADIVMVHGFDSSTPAAQNPPTTIQAVNWYQLSQLPNGVFPLPGKIRIPATTGQWYSFTLPTASGYSLAQGNEYLQLMTAFPQGTAPAFPAVVAYDTTSTGYSSCDIQLGNDILPFHQPTPSESGCIIDLYNSQIPTAWYTQQSTLPNNVPAGAVVCGPDNVTAGNVISRTYSQQMDVMFSPRGNVTGTVSAMGAMFFLIRDVRDATTGINPASTTATPQGEALILAVFPQTGLVQTYDLDMTDANGDQIADNVLNFAQRGMSAGK